MKKLTFILAVCLLFGITAFAGGIPESIIRDKTYVVFTGEITEVTDITTSVRIEHMLMGEVEYKEITLPYFEFLGTADTIPKVGDYCLITLDENGYVKHENNGFVPFSFKTTSTDPKKLKFKNTSGINMYDRMEKMVNDGEFEKAEKERVTGLPSEEHTPGGSKIKLILYLIGGFIFIAACIILYLFKNKKNTVEHVDKSDI